MSERTPTGSRGAAPEYVIRVKLPSPSAFHCSPSGDCEYEDAYDKAINDALPPGFEVVKLKPNEKWAKDSEGRSLVILRPRDLGEGDILNKYIERLRRAETVLEKIRDMVC